MVLTDLQTREAFDGACRDRDMDSLWGIPGCHSLSLEASDLADATPGHEKDGREEAVAEQRVQESQNVVSLLTSIKEG